VFEALGAAEVKATVGRAPTAGRLPATP